MYTNTNSMHGPETTPNWIANTEEIPHDFPTNFSLYSEIVMTNNVSRHEDTHWLQTCGTSMGTSCQCTYATIYRVYFERKHIILK
jgi:hypothetical protein